MPQRASCIAFLGVMLAGTFPVLAGTLSFSGTFSEDDSQFSTTFTLLTTQTVTIETWSYAGGTDPVAGPIAAGGFAPVLSLFDPSGNIYGNYDAGGVAPNCAPRSIDPVSGFCLDAYLLETSLSPGTYTVVLTEWYNTPNGPTLSDGFAEDGQGDFTGGFIDPGGYQRTDYYDFSISGLTGSSSAPEPAVAWSVGSGLILGWVAMRRRRIQPGNFQRGGE
jgi:hypothetical protein